MTKKLIFSVCLFITLLVLSSCVFAANSLGNELQNSWNQTTNTFGTIGNNVGNVASNIGKGQKQGSSPSADTAVKIAAALGVTVEYLVTGSNTPVNKKNHEEEQNQLRLYRKHSEIIKKCEELSSEKEKLLVDFIEQFTK